ncbi:alkane hydroxylase MAH1 isoform X2 [Lathyrus oleraceus]|uniref:alkane hydroxylase MAH1 isoform X2 n=1 Tax=Pisum sativum TaxID=3888 RepID=UPI0021CDF186|nr:alkane hydroxylase MAH1-like isoform X2 [Pisum sativum]
MNLYQFILLFLSIFFIIVYNIWRRTKNVVALNWPIIGMLPSLLLNLSNFHDFITLGSKHYGTTFHFKGPWLTNMANIIITCDPMNVNHITSKNFSNYGKGSDFLEIFDAFGVGIFNLDSNEWKQERALLHSLLKRKSFESFHQNNIQKKLESCLLPLLDLSCKDVAYVKALAVLDDTHLSRHLIPKCIWKVQKWLQIGQERKRKVARENLHQFLYKCITYSKGLDEYHPCLLKELMKRGMGNDERVEKHYLRDTALNLLLAGDGTISSGLSWFFWLVSTHPIVEAKIIQEIKDNYLAQEENSITNLSMEDIDKLVYLHGAICEALRLYPPVPFEHKCAVKSDVLPSGHHVSANTKLIYFFYAMGRMEEIWGEDCLEFKPERWISENGQNIHVPSYKFIAFNAGPRSCIGKGISLIQMKMVATSILWKFHIHAVESQRVTPKISIVLRMEHGLKVKVSKRCI